MPGDGRYPISTFADLQYAVARAPHDLAAAQAVRDFLVQAHHYRLMTGSTMDGEQYRIVLAQLQEAQRKAAERGAYFTLEWGGVVVNPPAVPSKPPSPAPRAPAGVHFTSHQRVGDEIRDSYIEHVHDMFARGFIDAGEHDARLKALMLARTKEEMEFLIQDLPKVPAKMPGETGGQVKSQKRELLLYPALAATSGTGALGLLAEAPANLAAMVIFIVLVVVSAAFTGLALTSFLKRGK